MGIFDFIFNNKKKEEQERLERERQAELQRKENERIERERKARLAENRHKEECKRERELAESLQPFTFKSNCHQRYENTIPVQGLQECFRTITVVTNTNGCQGYRLQPDIGYIVRIYNDDLDKPNMSDKPMKVVRKTDSFIELRGFPIEAQTPFGWQEVDLSDYGFLVYYKNGEVEKCVLHMYDRNIRIEYMKKENERTEREREARLAENQQKSNTQSSIDALVNECLHLEANGYVAELQDSLYRLYTLFNKPGGGLQIINYKRKDNLALCFAFMLQYDWIHDSDIREVWAENGFYCIIEHILHQSRGRQGQIEAMIILFVLLCVGRKSLKPKVQNIISKAKYDAFNRIFHEDDIIKGADNVIDQFSFLAVSEVRGMGSQGAEMMFMICEEYNGHQFFQDTITRHDLMKYDVMDVMNKAKFISRIIGSILNDM